LAQVAQAAQHQRQVEQVAQILFLARLHLTAAAVVVEMTKPV
jgi:hypothetical protein